jgi:hypothetical protein
MGQSERRQEDRSSLFQLADIQLEQEPSSYRVKVRNLSSNGLMGEGGVKVVCGTRLTVQLRNIGAVAGSVAWVQDDRFGVAFDEEIDPNLPQIPEV